MPRIEHRQDDFSRFCLVDDRNGEHRVEVLPERGALVTSYSVNGHELLYLDPATLADRTKNVRGGVPVLFPMAGKLAGERYSAEGRDYSMKQHGFARNSEWKVVEQRTEPDPRLVLALESNEATRSQFPWDFEVRFSFVLANGTLRIEQRYENRSKTAMPLHAGFHPYFAVPDAMKSETRIATDATRAYDNTRGVEQPFTGFDLTQKEVDLFLLDHRPRTVSLRRPDGRGVEIEMDAAFRTVVVWTLSGKDYVCVEPWTAPGNALNTGAGLVPIPPGGMHETWIAIRALG